MGLGMDVAVGALALLTPILVAITIWGISGMSPSAPFGWHPVLMSLAFPALMTMGRWSYITDSIAEKGQKRSVHRALMGFAAIVMLLGYLCIFLAHLPNEMFFGYDFKKKAMKPLARVVHAWVGYALIVAVLAQGVMGVQKLNLLNTEGKREYTFHGDMGKAIMGFGILNIIIAVDFIMPWSTAMKVVISLVSCASGAVAMFWPKPDTQTQEEQRPITSA
eukprot:TRINITY_DN2762_c0_g2_i1.p1 TRINITY_DN2762_c0_g2~~TRINITY_DN2762_c0_g2_i1.p1  ORF type:complete len:220 (-),score=36.53 TRINITY_DN2762_c0_g2_i1:243-902(-)